MRLSNGIALLLIISAICVFLVSADVPVDNNVPGQQITPNMTGGPSPGGEPDKQNTAPDQSGQVAGSDAVQPVHTPAQKSPEGSGTNPGSGSGQEENKQPGSPSVTSQPQVTATGPGQGSGRSNPGIEPGETVSAPVQPSEQPAGSKQTPSSPSGSGGSYREIQFPSSYPHFKQNNAAILVSSTPAGAGVYLDGSYKGTTPSSGYLEITDLSPGTYTVRLTYSGYSDYSTEVILSRNEISTISADMTAEYVASSYGALSVQADPSGAEVYLDNEYKGITPLTLQQIVTG
ncbi:MAG: PEGA domain-containing protein, partial [Methanospirillum sp.]|nr:PEGA domain-containing protein [Methanospirillum sp.]